jgi:hypothetical protein
MPLIKEVQRGSQFAVNVTYDTNPLRGRMTALWEFPISQNPETDFLLPGPEIERGPRTSYQIVTHHKISRLGVMNQESGSRLNLLQAMPREWKPVIVTFPDGFRTVAHQNIFIKAFVSTNAIDEGQRTITEQSRIVLLEDTQRLAIPVYRVRDQDVDQTAIEIVWFLGLSQAVAEGHLGFNDCSTYARKYIAENFGEQFLKEE